MPIVFSYDFENAEAKDHNRIQSMFERFGWEGIGGSCYRYPVLPRVRLNHPEDAEEPPIVREDWLNCVVPALMCFRAYVCFRKLRLSKHSLDAQASTGSHGAQPRPGNKLKLRTDAATQFGAKVLRKWVDAAANAFPAHYK